MFSTIKIPLRLQPVLRILIIVFVLWHCAAVAVTSFSDTFKGDFSAYLTKTVRPIFRPYTHAMFNQKQSWRAFSSPGRKVSHYYIEQKEGSDWLSVASIDPDHFSFRRRSHNMKAVLNLAQNKKSRVPLRTIYLDMWCKRADLADGTTIRLRERYYVIPKEGVKNGPTYWNAWDPEWKSKTVDTSTCETTSS